MTAWITEAISSQAAFATWWHVAAVAVLGAYAHLLFICSVPLQLPMGTKVGLRILGIIGATALAAPAFWVLRNGMHTNNANAFIARALLEALAR